MDFSFLIQDIIPILKKNIKYIMIGAIVMALLCGAAGYLRSSGGSDMTADEQSELVSEYESNAKRYEEFNENKNLWKSEMEEDINQLLKLQADNPLTKLDPNNVSYAEVFTKFSNEESDWRLTVRGWLETVDPKKLLDTDDEMLLRFADGIIFVDGGEGSTRVAVFDLPGYDYEKVADNVRKAIDTNAEKNKVDVKFHDVVKRQGFSEPLQLMQNFIKDNVNRAHNEFNNFNNYSKTVSAPVAPSTGGISKKTLLKYMILGFVLGAMLIVFLLLFPILKNGYLISKEQIEEMFPVDFLGDLSEKDGDCLEFAEASLGSLVEDNEGIILLDFGKEEKGNDAVRLLTETDRWGIIRGKDLSTDKDSIRAMKDVKDILIGITLGRTMAQDVQKVMVRAHRLDKKILGYVLI